MMTISLEERLKHYRLNRSEYDKICQILGRPPEGLEWPIFSALWSEHCSYKSSKFHLRKFSYRSPRVLQGFGENAGVIDLGEGERVAFKMESHNHPSFIEPYQGAATGVGGILRDVFTMGARPIMLADYLCFGEINAPRMIGLVDGVVRGISGYGNCVGVPTVTGQTEFHSSYNGNILVNALALGVFRPGDPVLTASGSRPGHLIVYVGAKTGRDGVHGASMASESFDEKTESKKPTIQKGDPFFEKLLIESCLEVGAADLVEAIQDMGAAGLTSSSFEMAARAGVGFRIDLDEVPLRDATIGPEEILLSESQERMLLVCRPENWEAIRSVFAKWDLDAAIIGEVIPEREMQFFWHGEKVLAIDPHKVVEQCPVYEREDRPYDEWQSQRRRPSPSEVVPTLAGSDTLKNVLLGILASPQGGRRDFIYRQYDQRVGARTLRDAEHPVAAVRLEDSGRAIGLALGCQPTLMRFDAAEGAKDALARPCLELAAYGFEPLAATDCLNFGNPENKKVMSELVAAIDQMSAMGKALGVPVISGNVSLYNETLGQNITATPATGIVGLRPSPDRLPESTWKGEGAAIYLLRSPQLWTLGAWAEVAGDEGNWGYGQIDPAVTAEFVRHVLDLSRRHQFTSVRVVGRYGLAYALARLSLAGWGAEILADGPWRTSSLPGFWLQERCYEVLVTTEGPGTDLGDEAFYLGRVGGDRLRLGRDGEWTVAEIRAAYAQGLSEMSDG